MDRLSYDARNLYGNLGAGTTADETIVDPAEMESLANEASPNFAVVSQAQSKNIWLGVAGLFVVLLVLNLV